MHHTKPQSHHSNLHQPTTYLTCPYHNFQSLSLICTQQTCNNRGLICPLCQHYSHNDKDHQLGCIKSMRIVGQMMHQDFIDSQSSIKYAAYIDIKIQEFQDIVQNGIEESKIRDVMRESIDYYFGKVRKILKGDWYSQFECLKQKAIQDNTLLLDNTELHSAKTSSKHQTPQSVSLISLNKMLLQYLNWANLQKHLQKSNFLNKMDDFKQDIEQKQNSLKQTIKKKKCDQSTAEIFLSQSESRKLRFSQVLKHPNIQISEGGRKATLKDHFNSVLCLVQPQLKSKSTIIFKATSLPSWISFGICYLGIVKQNCYKLPTANHGTFQISYDGYTSAHNSTENQNYHGWYFNQQDIITIEFNPKLWTLTFLRNQQHNNKHILNVVPPNNGQKMYFCAGLNTHEETVEIIDH